MRRLWVLGALATAACSSSTEAPRQPAPSSVAIVELPAQPAPKVEPGPVTDPAPSSVASEAAAPKVERGSLVVERTLPLGKWPEDVVVVGDEAWVAESGARRVARVPLDGKGTPARIGVGRLPVQIGLSVSGKIYTLAQTDKTLWEIDPKSGGARVRATLSDCPESMSLDGATAWVLLWAKCSSAGSSVARADLAPGKQSVSPPTGANAWELAAVGDRVWVGHGDGALTSVAATLQDARDHGTSSGPHSSAHVAGGRGAVYVGGGGTLSRTDATSGQRTHSVSMPVGALALDGDALWVLSEGGKILALDPATLSVRKELVPATPFEANGFARWGDRFVATVHGPGETGSLLVLAVAPNVAGTAAQP